MTIRTIPFFYDEQLRRYLTQLVKSFSGYQFEYMQDGEKLYKQVPCSYAQTSNQVATIIANNSENSLNSIPCIVIYITDIEYIKEETRPPSVVSSVNVYERKLDSNGHYTSEIGDKYRVDRLAPIPFKVSFNVDILTSNMEQKLQLFEQIGSSMNRGFDIQNSVNPIEYTSRTTVYFDSFEWSNNQIPRGNSNELEVMTLKYNFQFLLNQAGKVTKLNIVERVVTSISEGSVVEQEDITEDNGITIPIIGDSTNLLHVVTVPKDANIIVYGDYISIQSYEWDDIISDFGKLQDGISKIRIFDSIDENKTFNITGKLYKTSKPDVLRWEPDSYTLPLSTIQDVSDIIDPLKQYPGRKLPIPINGTRYLVTNELGVNQAWGLASTARLHNINYGDIIEYSNGLWLKVFSFSNNISQQIVKNIKNGKLYTINFDTNEWEPLLDGLYHIDYWRLEV